MNEQQLDYLIRQARSDEQLALARMAELRAQLAEQRRQLTVLGEYLAQPPAAGGSVRAGHHARARQFSAQVDTALQQQQQLVAQTEQACDGAHEDWARRHADRRALEQLLEQRLREESQQRHRVEQQQLEETARHRWLAERGDTRA